MDIFVLNLLIFWFQKLTSLYKFILSWWLWQEWYNTRTFSITTKMTNIALFVVGIENLKNLIEKALNPSVISVRIRMKMKNNFKKKNQLSY